MDYTAPQAAPGAAAADQPRWPALLRTPTSTRPPVGRVGVGDGVVLPEAQRHVRGGHEHLVLGGVAAHVLLGDLRLPSVWNRASARRRPAPTWAPRSRLSPPRAPGFSISTSFSGGSAMANRTRTAWAWPAPRARARV